MFNSSFQLGLVPQSWKSGIILKNPDPSLFASYRPITLLSCVGKLLVAARLNYVAERGSMLSSGQCSFRVGVSTLDVLLHLEQHTRFAQDAAQVYLVVYVNLKAAFDKVWVDVPL